MCRFIDVILESETKQMHIISYKLPSDRLNNHSRSRELITFLYDVADL